LRSEFQQRENENGEKGEKRKGKEKRGQVYY
jgi:hypothetical protein